MEAMRTDSPDVPTLLTNYILKGMSSATIKHFFMMIG